ncbi:MAG: hypothetical protein AB1847_20825 [bacterium]
MRYSLLPLVIVSFLLLGAGKEAGKEAEKKWCELREQTSRDSIKVLWQLEKIDGKIILTTVRGQETHVTVHDQSCSTQKWLISNKQAHTDAVARRAGEYILMKGLFKGKPIDEKVAVDDLPWYQAMSLSLGFFSCSDQTSVEFWTLRPDDLTPHKMRAMKKQSEYMTFNGKKIQVQKVRVSLGGLLSFIWSGEFWFRKEDGMFMKYQGANGPPGASETIITLVQEKPWENIPATTRGNTPVTIGGNPPATTRENIPDTGGNTPAKTEKKATVSPT